MVLVYEHLLSNQKVSLVDPILYQDNTVYLAD